jgi:hypothetical protein
MTSGTFQEFSMQLFRPDQPSDSPKPEASQLIKPPQTLRHTRDVHVSTANTFLHRGPAVVDGFFQGGA